MAKTDQPARSFEESRFQHWLRDTSRTSTFEVPGPKQRHLQWAHTHMKDRESHARARARETPEERELRLKKDRERHAERRAQLRAQGLPCNSKTERPLHLDPSELLRRRALNREAQQRWRDRLTTEKKKQLLQVRREQYYPTEREQKRGKRHR